MKDLHVSYTLDLDWTEQFIGIAKFMIKLYIRKCFK
jgi:hypothetical protein